MIKKIIKKNFSQKNYNILKSIYRKILILFKLLISVFYILPAIILYFLNCTFMRVYANRVGHLTADMRIKIKEKIINNSKKNIIAFHIENKIANKYILKYFDNYLFFIRSKVFGYFLLPFTWINFMNLDGHKVSAALGESQYSSIISLWGDRDPLFKIKNEDLEIGQKFLKEIGFQEDDWFVCLHARDSGYSLKSNNDDYGQEFRNVFIDSYLPAINFILNKGGKCIRMGDESSAEFPEIAGVFDYAKFNGKKDYLDVFLFSQCSFSLCCDSGVIELSNLFGTPAAITNLVPLSNALHGISKNICIPKLYSVEGKLVPFREIMSNEMANYRFNHQFTDSNIDLIDNSKDEILEITKEMYELVFKNNFNDKESEILSRKFENLFKPGHYMYRGAAKISKYFLKKYENLI